MQKSKSLSESSRYLYFLWYIKCAINYSVFRCNNLHLQRFRPLFCFCFTARFETEGFTEFFNRIIHEYHEDNEMLEREKIYQLILVELGTSRQLRLSTGC